MAWHGQGGVSPGDMCQVIQGGTMDLEKEELLESWGFGYLIGLRHGRVFWVVKRAVPTRWFFRVLTTYAQGKICI